MKTLKCTVLGLCLFRGNFFFCNHKYCDFLAELLYHDASYRGICIMSYCD